MIENLPGLDSSQPYSFQIKENKEAVNSLARTSEWILSW